MGNYRQQDKEAAGWSQRPLATFAITTPAPVAGPAWALGTGWHSAVQHAA